MSEKLNCRQSNVLRNEFILDSGATNHMVNDKMLLKDTKDKNSFFGVAKNNETLHGLCEGKLVAANCTINNVTYVPDLSCNLLSVSSVTANNGSVEFNKNKVIIQKDNVKVLEGNKTSYGLFVLKLPVLINEEKSNSSVFDWHRKLGHLGLCSLKSLTTMSSGMNLKMKDFDLFNEKSEVCIMSKQTREPFNSVRQRATCMLEIIHTDCCSPIDPLTWDDMRYFVTFLDDFFHHTTVYLIKHKSEISDIVKEYITNVGNQKNMKVSTLHCDNGTEYKNNSLQTWCKKRGIKIDFTIPHSPQLNGKSEHLNRSLLVKARAMLF